MNIKKILFCSVFLVLLVGSFLFLGAVEGGGEGSQESEGVLAQTWNDEEGNSFELWSWNLDFQEEEGGITTIQAREGGGTYEVRSGDKVIESVNFMNEGFLKMNFLTGNSSDAKNVHFSKGYSSGKMEIGLMPENVYSSFSMGLGEVSYHWWDTSEKNWWEKPENKKASVYATGIDHENYNYWGYDKGEIGTPYNFDMQYTTDENGGELGLPGGGKLKIGSEQKVKVKNGVIETNDAEILKIPVSEDPSQYYADWIVKGKNIKLPNGIFFSSLKGGLHFDENGQAFMLKESETQFSNGISLETGGAINKYYIYFDEETAAKSSEKYYVTMDVDKGIFEFKEWGDLNAISVVFNESNYLFGDIMGPRDHFAVDSGGLGKSYLKITKTQGIPLVETKGDVDIQQDGREFKIVPTAGTGILVVNNPEFYDKDPVPMLFLCDLGEMGNEAVIIGEEKFYFTHQSSAEMDIRPAITVREGGKTLLEQKTILPMQQIIEDLFSDEENSFSRDIVMTLEQVRYFENEEAINNYKKYISNVKSLQDYQIDEEKNLLKEFEDEKDFKGEGKKVFYELKDARERMTAAEFEKFILEKQEHYKIDSFPSLTTPLETTKAIKEIQIRLIELNEKGFLSDEDYGASSLLGINEIQKIEEQQHEDGKMDMSFSEYFLNYYEDHILTGTRVINTDPKIYTSTWYETTFRHK